MNIESGKSTPAIHAGSLWQINPQVNLYFFSEMGSASPFSNPKFASTFNVAKRIILFTSPILSHLALPLDDKIKFFASKIDLSEEELTKLLQTMPRALGEITSRSILEAAELDKFESASEKALALVTTAIRLLLPTVSASEHIKERIDHKNQTLSYLFNEEELTLSSKHQDFLAELSSFALLALCKNEASLEFIKNILNTLRAASALGLTPSDLSQTVNTPPNLVESLEPYAKKIWGEEWQDTLTRYNKTMMGMQEDVLERLTERIEGVIAQGERSLLMIPEFDPQSVLLKLKEKNIEMVGPIRESIKPRGYLFQIEKAGQVVGHFLGSYHLTPNWILESFNSKIEDAFLKSDVLAVEIDVTKQEHKEALELATLKRWEKNPFFESREERQEFLSFLGERGIQIVDEKIPDRLLHHKLAEIIGSKEGIESGIDLKFIERAKMREMEIIDLESMDMHLQQIQLLEQEETKFNEATRLEIQLSRSAQNIHAHRVTNLREWAKTLIESQVSADVINFLMPQEAFAKAGLQWPPSQITESTIKIALDYFDSEINQEMRRQRNLKFESLLKKLRDSIHSIKTGVALNWELGFIGLLEAELKNTSQEIKECTNTRNMEMALTVSRLVRSGKKPFAIAGALHFAGEGSVIKNMERMGYKITQIICEEPR
ncbi:TraB family protein [Estrella lausannensis]|uniref:TraB family protein n=2 Tax=Estrella lausannensis TaxID=483423 RepID=A0A0H5DNI0_9BACT|nr:TraB family protein [Estrella lausannensis]